MKVIENALSESLLSRDRTPRAGWWGFNDGKNHYIMRYNHFMVRFNAEKTEVLLQETVTDRNGVRNAVELIERWRLDSVVVGVDSSPEVVKD